MPAMVGVSGEPTIRRCTTQLTGRCRFQIVASSRFFQLIKPHNDECLCSGLAVHYGVIDITLG